MRPSCPVCDRPFRLLCDPKLRSWRHNVGERVCPYCKAALRVVKPSRRAELMRWGLLVFQLLTTYAFFGFGRRLRLPPGITLALFYLEGVAWLFLYVIALFSQACYVPAPSPPAPDHRQAPPSSGRKYGLDIPRKSSRWKFYAGIAPVLLLGFFFAVGGENHIPTADTVWGMAAWLLGSSLISPFVDFEGAARRRALMLDLLMALAAVCIIAYYPTLSVAFFTSWLLPLGALSVYHAFVAAR